MQIDLEAEYLLVDSYCPACDGEAYRIGKLGKLVWCRCRYCGIDYYEESEE